MAATFMFVQRTATSISELYVTTLQGTRSVSISRYSFIARFRSLIFAKPVVKTEFFSVEK